nr:MAG TPA: hypothetical protein [Caudoviricetes sp.]
MYNKLSFFTFAFGYLPTNDKGSKNRVKNKNYGTGQSH